MTDNQIIIKTTFKSIIKLFFTKLSAIHGIFMQESLSKICEQIKLGNENFAKEKIELLKDINKTVSEKKLIDYLAILFKTVNDINMSNVPETFVSFIDNMYKLDSRSVSAVYLVLNKDIGLKLLDLAEEADKIFEVGYLLFKMFLNFFKFLDDWEPQTAKKMREDIEYVELIQMYLNGSKDLPERKTDNFNYALLSEFLKKDDLRVLKSLEDYLDSRTETKALGAAGAVAQSIEKEDLEPGIKKKKKDIKRIEELE